MLKHQVGTRVVQRTHNRLNPIKAAIIVFDPDIQILEHPLLTTENMAVATLITNRWTIGVLSFYLEEEQPIEEDIEKIKGVCEKLQLNKIFIGGDSNAWSTWWGSARENHRGETLFGALGELDMEVLNEGSEPTFDTIRGGKLYQSHVDITACKTDMLGEIQNWRVDKGITSSDHNAIIFTINLEKPTAKKPPSTTRKFNTKKANWTEFGQILLKELCEKGLDKKKLNNVNTQQMLEETVQDYIESVDKACMQAIPQLKPNSKIKLPWWSEKLAELKEVMVTRKRRISYTAPRRRPYVENEYLKAKEEFEEEAKNAIIKSWKNFCQTQDRESMWDGIYRVIRNRSKRHEDQPLLKNGEVLSMEDSAKHLATTFFPDDSTQEDTEIHKEIRLRAERSHEPKKTPGPDGFSADICAEAIKANSETFLALINCCLRLSYFPKPWKVASVVILRKPGKDDYTQAKSYRPIGLLSIMGKIMEKLLVRRVRWHILPKANLKQYGFVPQRCTEDSLYDLLQHINKNSKLINVVVSLDIEGAFDSAWWPAIKTQLLEKGCPYNLRKLLASYLTDREVCVRYGGSEYIKATTKGCVQGSIGGPTLWNVLLDPLLNDLEERGVYCQAFADDIVLVFSGNSTPIVEAQADRTLAYKEAWGLRYKLKFAAHKTHAMVITNKMKWARRK
ncbi:hypothetical protein O0L34_g19237 [Tuta absoluta]|nr:hypothetical protein O0L34_g19237 [Tuta absoluta]